MAKSSGEFAKGFIVYHVMPYFLAGFGLFAFGRLIFSRLGLSSEVDQGREFETRDEYLTRNGVRSGNQPCQPDAD
jgi:hypothetical protein